MPARKWDKGIHGPARRRLHTDVAPRGPRRPAVRLPAEQQRQASHHTMVPTDMTQQGRALPPALPQAQTPAVAENPHGVRRVLIHPYKTERSRNLSRRNGRIPTYGAV